MFETIRQYVVAFDEYHVKNYYPVLRPRTEKYDTADNITFKAKEIDECKHDMVWFKSNFVPPRKFNFSSKKINTLMFKAAEFLTTEF